MRKRSEDADVDELTADVDLDIEVCPCHNLALIGVRFIGSEGMASAGLGFGFD